MKRVCQGLHWKTLLIYLDDIIVKSPDFDIHLARLAEVLRRLDKAVLKLKHLKCALLQKGVAYLWHMVSPAGIPTEPERIAAVK